MSEYSYLKPKVGSPKMLRDERNGRFVNPPLMMRLGGFKSSAQLHRDTEKNLRMEGRGPKAAKGPI